MGDDTDLDAALPSGGQQRPSMAPMPTQGGGDDALDQAMRAVGNRTAAAENPAPDPDPMAVAHATNIIHGDAKYTDATPWGNVASGFKKNAIPDLMDTAKGVAKGAYGIAKGAWNAATSPVQTATDISHFVAPQNADQQAHRQALMTAAKAAGKGFLNQENQIWGTEGLMGGHTAGLKGAIAEKPFSEVAMDASTLAGGAGLAARGAGLARTADALSTASRLTDTILGAVKAAKVAASPAVWGARKIQGLTTSVPAQFLKEAALAGASPNPQVRSAFNRHHWGTAPTDEPLKAVSDAFDTLKTNEFNRLRGDKRLAYASNPGAVPFNDVDTAFNNSKAALNRMPPSYAPDIREQFQKVENLINDWRADPNLRTMENMDRLRNEVGMLQHADKSRFTEHIGPIYGAVRGSMEKVSPEYTKTLEQISEAQREFKDMARTMGVNAFDRGTAMTPTLLARQIRSQMSSRGREIMDKLNAIDPRIKPMLAGVATHEVMPHGLAARGLGLLGSAGVGASIANPSHTLGLLGTGVGALASSSPRLAGALNYGYGALDRAANSLPVKGMYYAGKDRAAEAPQQPEGPDHFAKIQQIESGGKQFLDDGKTPLRSPAGAVGISQIMPATMPEAAEAAGEAPNMDRLLNDEKYNTKVGRALFNKRMEEFGDPEHAAAANNSNPATVHGAMKKAKLNGGDWRDYLPPETQKYIKKFLGLGRDGRASGGRTGINHAAEATKLVSRADSAKKALGKATEPLLNVSDDHIAKALAVANESV